MIDIIPLVIIAALIMDLLLPFLLAPFATNYHHLQHVMSLLGNKKCSVHVIYNLWLIIFGMLLLVGSYYLYTRITNVSHIWKLGFCFLLVSYAIGACILAGIFSVEDTKEMSTTAAKIHGIGSVLGFMLLLFIPLVSALYFHNLHSNIYSILCWLCFVLALVTFIFFIMSDKENFQGTWIAYEGLWQRLTLFFMYIPIACTLLYIK